MSKQSYLTQCCLLLFVCVTSGSYAEEPNAETLAHEFVQPAEKSIALGLQFIASRQLDDGAFGTRGYNRNPAVVALAGMAFLSNGSTPGRGPYGNHLTKITNYLLQHSRSSGFIIVPNSESHGPMYGHGFATLYLAQVYGMSPRDDLRDKLGRAVKLIVQTQNAEGGWRYQPEPTEADSSVTVCQIMALRAARDAGIHVPRTTIERSTKYIKSCQHADGGFGYMPNDPKSQFPRSAAGVVSLMSVGIYKGKEINRGLNYLEQVAAQRTIRRAKNHYFYGQYYSIQAMWHAGGERWKRWYPRVRDSLVTSQRSDGVWVNNICPVYGTAMACIVLQMPNNMVPIFQR